MYLTYSGVKAVRISTVGKIQDNMLGVMINGKEEKRQRHLDQIAEMRKTKHNKTPNKQKLSLSGTYFQRLQMIIRS